MTASWRWATEFDRAMLINAGLLFPSSYGKREEWLAALAMCPLFDGVKVVGPAGVATLTIPEGPFCAISISLGVWPEIIECAKHGVDPRALGYFPWEVTP